ncbi:hypothetical protein [Jannaschia donghaensis]|uniref:Uncharacterized protein n=1 Tax=Jannaschia donghaensis TaxID=420998 RepID=A0A0M6YHY0_9RHOB|nr:hypothetical protein [Jannaschia donghaensis]CTQ49560.1 hypothetical protein JDO7802_01574 [Jannaschia donghaensis]
MSNHHDWLKRTLAEILGADTGLPDFTIQRLEGFRPDDLSELLIDEREAVFGAFKQAAHESRNVRQATKTEDGQRVPPYVDGDIDWALRAAKSALEAVPAGKRSEKANELLAACTCPAATGPNPGIDGGSSAHRDPQPALDRNIGSPEKPLPY